MTNVSRRDALRAALGAGAAAAVGATAQAKETVEPASNVPYPWEEALGWHVSDDRFISWFFFKNDMVRLSLEPEPMKKTGMYVIHEDDGTYYGAYRLVFVSVVMKASGDPTDEAFLLRKPGGDKDDPVFNRLAPDAPKGHHVLWHRPKYWLKSLSTRGRWD